jgi:hypothetical protein
MDTKTGIVLEQNTEHQRKRADTMTTILGYETTKDREALAAFMAEALAQYQVLAQQGAAVDEKIEDLRKDWEPRPPSFWSPVLKTTLPAIRQAADTCLGLFDKKRSQERPVLPAIWLTSIVDLHSIEGKVEEAGILLTAYLRSSPRRSVEAQIRERQRILQALEQVSQAVHEAYDNAQVNLDKVREEHHTSLCLALEHPVSHLRPVEADREEGDTDEETALESD